MNEISLLMLTGLDRAVLRPNQAVPARPGHRGQLARLIRERPVFVNVAGGLFSVLGNGLIGVKRQGFAAVSKV
jgi:hypothetical protein